MKRIIGVLSGLAMAMATITHAAAPTGRGLENLRCEYFVNPLGLMEPLPRLSWELRDERRGAAQSAYRVVVSSDQAAPDVGAAMVWDSGRVTTNQTINVIYQGPALKPQARYYWKVQVWDKDGQALPWSSVAWWEMGLPPRHIWNASWITFPRHLDLQSQKHLEDLAKHI